MKNDFFFSIIDAMPTLMPISDHTYTAELSSCLKQLYNYNYIYFTDRGQVPIHFLLT